VGLVAHGGDAEEPVLAGLLLLYKDILFLNLNSDVFWRAFWSGIWASAWDSSHTAVTLKSLYWPGYFFYHQIGTGEYGSAYFGYGTKNTDLAFML
jgi:hypothetical protein